MSHLACKPHNFQASSDSDVKLECPYCIIDNLTAENQRLKQQIVLHALAVKEEPLYKACDSMRLKAEAENERLREALERIEAARLPWPDEEAQCTDISSLITGMKDIAREALEDSHVRS